VLGLSDPIITQIMRKLRGGLRRERWNTLPAPAKTVQRILNLSRRMEGFPHHLSVHCGGVVLTPDPACRHAPLLRAQKGVVITQYDKDAVEAVGLVKLDLLGNRALSSAGEGFRLVNERLLREQGVDPQSFALPSPVAGATTHADKKKRKAPVSPQAGGHTARAGELLLDPEHLPDGDPATARLLQMADTIGVNQLESPAMRHLLRQLQPYNVRRVMQVLALIRPGAASLGMKEEFVRRARGITAPRPMDPRLDYLLSETYGIMVYEDDALQIASALSGLAPGDADRFRRAITKHRTDEQRRELSERFLGLCRGNDVDMDIAADLWTQMAKFNSYSFCRAHAASYARLAWANAWLKAHHPAEFWVGALNHNQGIYSRWVYVEEARRMGVSVRLPCVNVSADMFTLEDGAIRTGLMLVRGLTERTLEAILDARPFADPLDLVARTPARLEEVENLIRAGAFDFTGRKRPEMVLAAHAGYESAKRLRGHAGGLFDLAPPTRRLPELPDYDEAQRWFDEWSLLGISPRAHPMAAIRPNLQSYGIMRSRVLDGRLGRHVRLCGISATARLTRTGKGDTMAFVTISDEDGLVDVTLFPDTYKRCREVLADECLEPLVVDGTVDSQYDALTVTARNIRPLAKSQRVA
jgi:DNA polymerase III alpha subunit